MKKVKKKKRKMAKNLTLTTAKYLQEIKFFGASCIEKDLCMYAPTFYLEPCSTSLYPFMETSSST